MSFEALTKPTSITLQSVPYGKIVTNLNLNIESSSIIPLIALKTSLSTILNFNCVEKDYSGQGTNLLHSAFFFNVCVEVGQSNRAAAASSCVIPNTNTDKF